MAGRALVLGGTGMLAGCVAALVGEGWHVVLPSRRHAPIPAEPLERGDFQPGAYARAALAGGRGHKPTAHQPERRALWVQADWSEPDRLAARAEHALGGPADLLVAWVHTANRVPVLRAVRPLLAPDAPVVEVLGTDTTGGTPEPVLTDHPTQQVVLGQVSQAGRTRWLNHQEIADGVLAAVRRALAGRPPATHQVGEVPMPYGHRD